MPREVSPRGVLFDVDDTLIDTRAAFAAAIATVTARFLPDLPVGRGPDVLAAWRRDDDGHFRAYTRGETDFRGQRRSRAKALQAAFGGPALDDGALEAWETCFEAAIRGAWRAHPDAVTALADVRARGLAVG